MTECVLTAATAAAREDLRRAATLPWQQPSDIGTVLAHLSATVTAMDQLLDGLSYRLNDDRASERLDSVDGLFNGDLSSAIDTARLWLISANLTCGRLQTCLDNANIAVGGLAEPPGCTGRTTA